jgi:hypothetical protein
LIQGLGASSVKIGCDSNIQAGYTIAAAVDSPDWPVVDTFRWAPFSKSLKTRKRTIQM